MLKRLVTVATFDDSIRAALARNHLEAEGIAAVLNDEMTVATGWALSTAVGGIKLQVAPLQLERAEYLLAQLAEARAADGEMEFATSEEVARELAEERAAEREELNESNQLVERALRTAVIGLLFFPLQFYVWWVLLSLLTTAEPLSPQRRWKVWVAGAVSVLDLVLVFLMLHGQLQ